ncbi:MAG: type II toxin-antitoxin system HicB family antitoxin [Lutibacter sp.]|nr:type II toxin-antitoxin system HicB family antitoxin [Lutibacter sp.]
MKKVFTAIIEKTNTGFSGYIKEIDGIVTAGDSINEMKENFKEALTDYFEYLTEKEIEAPHINDVEINFTVDMEQFFEHYNVINKSAFAEYIGLNPSLFRQYIKGLTKLSDKKMLQITNGLHKLADDISDIVLVNN